MAQTNFTPILLYGSSTPTNVPLAANLTNSATGSEIAINVADKNLFFKDSTNAVNTVPIRQSSTSSNGWLSSTDWNTFNNKSNTNGTVTSVAASVPAFLSISGSPITTSGTLAITLSGTALPVANGGTGQTSFTAGQIHYGSFSTSANLFWDSANNRLGIGTSSPAYTLSVNGGSIATRISAETAGGVYYTRLVASQNFAYSGIEYASLFNFVDGATERMRIHSSGGVSIGNTTDPGAANLSVSGTVTAGLVGRQATYTAGATTPSVTGCTFIGISNSSPTTITNFTGGVTGQIITCYFLDSNTTVNRSNAYLNGGANFVSSSNDTLVLLCVSGLWYEISRSNNS